MVKYTEREELIKDVLGHIKNNVYKGTLKWKDENTLIFINKEKEEEGKIIFKDKELNITGKKIIDLYVKYKKNKHKNNFNQN